MRGLEGIYPSPQFRAVAIFRQAGIIRLMFCPLYYYTLTFLTL